MGTLITRVPAGESGIGEVADARAGKFSDPALTRDGERRAWVEPGPLETLWFNTGTRCNLTCATCYIESSPANDRLAYLARADVARFLEQARGLEQPPRLIGFTGGEPFMNPDFMDILDDTLAAGFPALVLTNAMRPMMKCADRLAELIRRYPADLTLRVSIDHYTRAGHEALRGERAWTPMIQGLRWLVGQGCRLHVAGRAQADEPEVEQRRGYARLFSELSIPIDTNDPAALVLFPEMDEGADVPEITEACWEILGVEPQSMMCASSRMVVRRAGAPAPTVLACTLIAYDPRFELGPDLAAARVPVSLNHPHCAKFCVLGGASCSAG